MKYQYLRNNAYKKYKKIRSVYCPYLKTRVKFTSKGFWHLIYASRNKKRDLISQKLRFRLLEKAGIVTRTTTTLQEYEEIKSFKTQYYGFIAIIDRWKIKVIIKKVGNGKPYFWSVIPNWVTNKKRDRIFYKGSLEKD